MGGLNLKFFLFEEGTFSGFDKTMSHRRRNVMKKSGQMFFVAVVILFILSMGWVSQIECQEKYPTRAIDIIVPFSPGGSTDLGARIVSAYLKTKWGVPVNVVNKPGGNTLPACVEVFQAKPDGYTILADGLGSSSMLPLVVKELPFKVTDRTFIAAMSHFPFVFAVAPDSPFKNLKDLEAEAKMDPGSFTWASLGGAALHDFAFRQFFKAIGIDVLKTKPIMSKGGSEAVVLTAGRHVKVGGGSAPTCFSPLKGGIIRGIGITSAKRWPELPDLPTAVEQGFTSVKVTQWIGISGPSNLPLHITAIWDKVIQEMLQDPKIISQLSNIGAIPFYLNPRETREFVRKETEEVADLWGKERPL